MDVKPIFDNFSHCASHKLNLALNATSSVPEFRVMMENVKKLGIFFTYSPKRSVVLRQTLERADPPVSMKKVRILFSVYIGYSCITPNSILLQCDAVVSCYSLLTLS